MDVAETHLFKAPLARVAGMFADREFAVKRGLSTGATECDAIVDGDVSGAFSVSIRRVMPTEGLQPEFKPWIGPSITIRYTEAWEPPSGSTREGTFAMEIVGAPARATGTLSLVPEGDATAFTIDGSVTARVPLLSALVTQAVVDAIAVGLKREFAAADRWLARPVPAPPATTPQTPPTPGRSSSPKQGGSDPLTPPGIPALSASPKIHFAHAAPRPAPLEQAGAGHPLVDHVRAAEILPATDEYTPRVSIIKEQKGNQK